MEAKPYDTSTWSTHPLHPKTRDADTVEWIFLVDLLNFSFFSDEADVEKQFYVTYQGEKYTGYWSLCAAVNRALDAGIPITSPAYWLAVDDETLRGIFRGEGEEPVPLMYYPARKLFDIVMNEYLVFEKQARSFAKNSTEAFSHFWKKQTTQQSG